MCTVTLVPLSNGVLITSNRDEKARRKAAVPPHVYEEDNVQLLFPKDGEKGGTWIGVNTKGAAAVLLNGALQPHLPDGKYSSSRGRVIPKVLMEKDAALAFTQLYLDRTEPFTLIIYQNNKLHECRWDGKLKTVLELPATQPHIWASATLYSKEVMQKRKRWFDEWLRENPRPDTEAVVSFHRFTGDGDTMNDLVINRDGETKTVSITSVHLNGKGTTMRYYDLLEQKRYRQSLPAGQSRSFINNEYWKRFSIRLLNWEYWPFHIVYLPIYVYYFWLSLKARSFFFFNAANPTIRHGGFLMESKKDIYDLLPKGTYPATALVEKGLTPENELQELVEQYQLQFPLIAKPDIGLRGIGVKKIFSVEDLQAYHQESKVDYLLQAFVPYTKEVGVFYYRFPGKKEGVITGMVGKELLSIKGNGVDTVEELLRKEQRFFLQLPSLRKQYGAGLSEVLPQGEERVIVPYGNHSRGAKFLDITHQLTPPLYETVNLLCRAVPGFYFGRLDIKYDNWEDLCGGKNFSIIELNGAGSEPAHIYDPKHSLLFAWKEIIRHLRILYRVSRQNKRLKKGVYLSVDEGIKLFKENKEYMNKIA